MVVTDYNEQFLDKRGTDHLIDELKAYIDGISTGSVDLSDYVTKSELQAKLDALHINIDLSSYATKEELLEAINSIDLSSYALKTEIPSLNGYATTEYVDNAIANVPSGGGNVDLSNYYTKTEVDTAISNIGVKYEYVNIYGTKLDIKMPQLPTFDGGTVLHITPPDGWSDFINAENDCMTVFVKKDKDREYIDAMNDDIIHNVDSKGNATPTLTISNTTAGFIDDYIIRGTQYSNNGTISLKSKQTGWLYDYQKIDNNLSCYTKWTTDFGDFASGIDGFRFIFDTSQRTGFVTFDFGQHDCYVNRASGGIIRKSRNSSFTVDVTNVNTYSIYVPVGTDDNLHMTCPEYTITYPDEITSGTFKIWTSDIDAVNTSTQYEFTVNVKQFTDEYYVRYGNEDLVKIIKPIIPTKVSELLNDVPFATETYVDNAVSNIPTTDLTGYATEEYVSTAINNIPATDLSNYYTKSETYSKTEVDTLVANSGGSSSGGSSGGASGITYAYDTEIATGETYFDGRPIYMKIFHIDALSSAPSDYIVYGNYHSQTPFADTLVSAEPIWQSNSNQKRFNGNVIQSFTSASGSSGSAAITAVNRLLKTVAWVQAWQSSSEFAITVTRGQDMYEYGCDVFVKYVKSA